MAKPYLPHCIPLDGIFGLDPSHFVFALEGFVERLHHGLLVLDSVTLVLEINVRITKQVYKLHVRTKAKMDCNAKEPLYEPSRWQCREQNGHRETASS